jgi:hypothetical protein
MDAGVDRGLTRSVVTTLVVALAFVAGVRAQTTACEDFKTALTARFESNGVRGFSLEAVPAGAPTPSDAKVIGNCESGAYKVLYRRWGAARAASAPSSAPAATGEAAAPARRRPSASSERASRALPASAPAPTPPKVMRAADASSAPQGSERAPVSTPASAASDVVGARTAEPAAIDRVASGEAGGRRVSDAPWARGIVDFAIAHWPWFGALVLLVLARWVWRTHLSPYDKDGLPRGPRL